MGDEVTHAEPPSEDATRRLAGTERHGRYLVVTLDDLYRGESRHVLATLIRLLGDFDLAESIYKNVDPEALDDDDKRLIALGGQIKQQFEIEQELLKNDPEDLPQVRLLTSRGEIITDLFINEAPSTVAHFINLVESGFYDGLDFFQVIDGLLALMRSRRSVRRRHAS